MTTIPVVPDEPRTGHTRTTVTWSPARGFAGEIEHSAVMETHASWALGSEPSTGLDASPEEVGTPPVLPPSRLPTTFDRKAEHKLDWSPPSDNWRYTAGTGGNCRSRRARHRRQTVRTPT